MGRGKGSEARRAKRRKSQQAAGPSPGVPEALASSYVNIMFEGPGHSAATPGEPRFERWLDDIDAAIGHELYMLALLGALAIPDICGALEATDGKSTGQRASGWFDRHLAAAYTDHHGGVYLDGATYYRLRCSLMHQGSTRPDRPGARYPRILLMLPHQSANIFRYSISEDALMLDVGTLCTNIVAVARRWLPTVEETPLFQKNMKRFLAYYPGGIRPYIEGLPLIT